MRDLDAGILGSSRDTASQCHGQCAARGVGPRWMEPSPSESHRTPPMLCVRPPPIPLLPQYERDYMLEAAFRALPAPPSPLPSDAARHLVALANQADVQQASVAGATAVAIASPPPMPLAAGPPTNHFTVLAVV